MIREETGEDGTMVNPYDDSPHSSPNTKRLSYGSPSIPNYDEDEGHHDCSPTIHRKFERSRDVDVVKDNQHFI
jgi:hypothetical protein